MIKVLKWAYKLGYDKARGDVFKLLDSEAQFHQSQAQIKELQKIDSKHDDIYKDRIYSSKDHDQRYQEVLTIQNRLDPERYPNIDLFMDLLK